MGKLPTLPRSTHMCRRFTWIVSGMLWTTAVSQIVADDPQPAAGASAENRAVADTPLPGDAPPPELKRLSKTGEIWLDTKRKAAVIDGQVCLREGNLEM